jgi:hypothetical protein
MTHNNSAKSLLKLKEVLSNEERRRMSCRDIDIVIEQIQTEMARHINSVKSSLHSTDSFQNLKFGYQVKPTENVEQITNSSPIID